MSVLETCLGAIWGQREAAGLESPLLGPLGSEGKKDEAESQKSDRGERESTGRFPGGGNLTAGKGWLDLEHQWDKLERSWQRTQ